MDVNLARTSNRDFFAACHAIDKGLLSIKKKKKRDQDQDQDHNLPPIKRAIHNHVGFTGGSHEWERYRTNWIYDRRRGILFFKIVAIDGEFEFPIRPPLCSHFVGEIDHEDGTDHLIGEIPMEERSADGFRNYLVAYVDYMIMMMK
jgi:hypothetical protein